jgi:hypothetical protein
MATINYVTELSLTDESNILLSNPTPPPTTFTAPALEDSTLTNMITGDDYLMTSSQFPTSPLPCSFTLNATVGGFDDPYPDSVYSYTGAIALSDDYTTSAYLLVTTSIDAGIAALPITTGMQQARKAYVQSLRAQIDTFFNAANYTSANAYIQYVEIALTNLALSDYPFTSNTFTLSAADDFTITIGAYTPLGGSVVSQGGWYNVITNTLTQIEYPYTWNFNYTIGGSNVVSNTGNYPDGVYTNLSSQMWVGTIFGIKDVRNSSQTKYALVTTTVDAQVTLFGDTYDTNNTAEALAYAEMQSLQTQIAAAWADEDYTLTNTLITQLQALLANGLSREVFAKLNDESNMLVYFETLPTGTYTDATGTITNTLTGVSFTFDGFPADNTDLTTILNSETLGFGSKFTDGVYQVTVQFYIDGLLYNCMCYLPVTSAWQCCIDKAIGKACGKLDTALQQSNLTNAVRIVALYSDVNTANALISEGNRVCSGCGCGC